jgi:hypothetical protein
MRLEKIMQSTDTMTAATLLEVSTSQVKRLLDSGKLRGVKVWRIGSIKPVWQIEISSINNYKKNRLPRGRPTKN